MKIQTLCAVICCTIIFAACKSKTKSSNTYQPITPGSTWKYKIEVPGLPTDEQTETMADGVTNFEGKVYHKMVIHLKSKDSTRYEFYAQNGNDYFTRSALETNSGDALNIDLLYLKDKMDAGGNWGIGVNKSIAPEGRFISDYKGTIVETGMTKTINGNTYQDIVHARIDMSVQININLGLDTAQAASLKGMDLDMGNLSLSFTVDFYVAKGIGIVELDKTTNGMGVSATEKQTLLSYQIK